MDIESDCNPRLALDGLAAVSWQWGELWGFWNTPGNAHEIGGSVVEPSTASKADICSAVCRRKFNAKAQPAFLAKTRCDLFADELQRAHDFFIAEETPAMELREDAIEAELAGQILEAHRHRCWSSDNYFIAQRIFIADGL